MRVTNSYLNLTRRVHIHTIHGMYIITRYVIREVLVLFLAALAAMTIVFTLTFGVREGFSRGLPASVIFWLMPFMLPEMLGMTIPVSILFAVCSVFGRMTGSNEIVALKSLGITPMAVVWPAIILAMFLSFGTVLMYEIAATWCRPKRMQIVAESVEAIIYGMLRKERSIDTDQYSITVKRLDGKKLILPTIVLKSQKITIAATEAELLIDPQTHTLEFICRDSTVDVGGDAKYTASVPGEQKYPVPLSFPRPERYHRDWVSMRDIPQLIGEIQSSL
jgi:lipopolysaccharide export system permease protein